MYITFDNEKRGYKKFGKEFFIHYQNELLYLLNTPVISSVFRKVLCIDNDEEIKSKKIYAITPNSYTIFLGLKDNKKHLQTVFRTHDKYSKRLYYSFRYIWAFLHFLDSIILDKYIPELSFGFATYYPDADPETTTVDGYLKYISAGATPAEAYVGDNGTVTAYPSDASGDIAYAYSNAAATSWMLRLSRSVFLFDTSDLDPSSIILSAIFSIYGVSHTATAGAGLNVRTSDPTSDTDIVAADYNPTLWSSGALSNTIIYNAWSNSGYNDFTLTADGRNVISKGGITKLGCRDYQDTTSCGVGRSIQRYATGYFADQAGTNNDPKLVIEYCVATSIAIDDLENYDDVIVCRNLLMSSISDVEGYTENIDQCFSTLFNTFDIVDCIEGVEHVKVAILFININDINYYNESINYTESIIQQITDNIENYIESVVFATPYAINGKISDIYRYYENVNTVWKHSLEHKISDFNRCTESVLTTVTSTIDLVPVLLYIPSLGVKQSLTRQFIANNMDDGYIIEKSAESFYSHPDGNGSILLYPGTNVFYIGYKKTLAGNINIGIDQLADLLWDFFLTRLDNLNEPFYFYNCPTECTTPDPYGVSTLGRYYVRLKDPNVVLNRELFLHCLYSYNLVLIENKEFNVINDLAVSQPWAYYKFNEAVASYDRIDSSGNVRNLTPSAVPSASYSVDGKISNCLYLPCAASGYPYVTVYDAPDLSLNKNILTSFWFKFNEVNSGHPDITAGLALTPQFFVILNLLSGETNCYLQGLTPNLSCVTGKIITPNVWHHILVYYDGVKLVTQVDNIFDSSYYNSITGDSGCIAPAEGSKQLIINGFDAANFMDCYIDELGIWTGFDALKMIQNKNMLYNDNAGLTYPIVYT